MSPVRIPPAPRPRPSQSARAFSAARAEYLAGAEPEAVCRRHDIRTAYFLRIAGEQGWRRPDPAPEPTPAVQDEPLVIPEAPQPSDLTAAQMAAMAWSHVQAALAAGRQIEARGWLRIHKDLQPHIRAEEAALHEAEQAPDDAVAPPLHCFSPSECNTPDPTHDLSSIAPCHPGSAEGVVRDRTPRQTLRPGRRDATIRATGSNTQAAAVRPAQPDGCPGGEIIAPVRPGSPLRFGRDDKETGSPLRRTDEVTPPLHCFSHPECKDAGPDPYLSSLAPCHPGNAADVIRDGTVTRCPALLRAPRRSGPVAPARSPGPNRSGSDGRRGPAC